MKAKFQVILVCVAVNSSFVHIVFHLRLLARHKESLVNVGKGIGREFFRFYLY
jgi:hypothetical protein